MTNSSNTLATHDKELITDVRGFKVQAHSVGWLFNFHHPIKVQVSLLAMGWSHKTFLK